MPWTIQDLPDASQQTFIVTGGNSGLGYETVRALARSGADVLLACRDEGKGQAAAEVIRGECNTARITVMQLDLASLASVRRFAGEVLEMRPRGLHGLVNNAGVMALPRMRTADGFEMQFGTNHLGHFALTGLLMGHLLMTPGSRVVTVSSMASRIGKMRWDDLDGEKHYDKWQAYGQSKLANLLFAFELARRFTEKQAATSSLACHPGYAATNLQHVGPVLEGARVGGLLMRAANALFAQSAAAGALPTLYALTSVAAHNGDFIGPAGIAQSRGAPIHVRARRAAYSPELMQRLWDASVERTGVDFAALG